MNKNIKRIKLYELLEQRKMTAYSFARALNYKPQAVYNWLYGIGTPSVKVMLNIMEVLNISADEVLSLFVEGT